MVDNCRKAETKGDKGDKNKNEVKPKSLLKQDLTIIRSLLGQSVPLVSHIFEFGIY